MKDKPTINDPLFKCKLKEMIFTRVFIPKAKSSRSNKSLELRNSGCAHCKVQIFSRMISSAHCYCSAWHLHDHITPEKQTSIKMMKFNRN